MDLPIPHNPEAERSVLGTMLIWPDSIDDIVDVLEPRHFNNDAHKYIYTAIQALHRAGDPVDLLTLKSFLDEGALLDRVGGASYLSSLVDGIPDVRNVATYVTLVVKKFRQREGLRAISKILDIANAAPDQIRTAIEALAAIDGHGDTQSADYLPVAEVADIVLQDVAARHESGDFFTGIRTGLEELDHYLLGLQRKTLTLIGAYTSHGKTAIGLDVILKILDFPDNADIHALYFALEMPKEMITYRTLSNIAGVRMHLLRSGRITEDGLQKAAAGAQRLADYGQRFLISDSVFTIDAIARVARERKRLGKLDLLVLDYIQLIEGLDDKNREREVNRIGRYLLQLAKELDIAVVAFAQLNEGVINREGHRPILSDMRESRALNQHARTVLLLSRPWLFDKENPQLRPCLTNVYIEKNSEGPLGEIELHFNGAIQRFEEGGCHPDCDNYVRPGLPTEEEQRMTVDEWAARKAAA